MSTGLNVKMIIVDSLTSHFRAEYVGRGMLANRQQKLNRHLKDLKQLAGREQCARARDESGSFEARRHVGGSDETRWRSRLAHASTFRLYLRKSKGGRRIARLVDSPNLPDGECIYQVTEEGLRD